MFVGGSLVERSFASIRKLSKYKNVADSCKEHVPNTHLLPLKSKNVLQYIHLLIKNGVNMYFCNEFNES